MHDLAAALGTPAVAFDQISPRVWRVRLATGRIVALKEAAAEAPLRGEVATLTWLQQRGCAVPQVLAVDSAAAPAWVTLEWCGDETLDQALQTASPARRAWLGRQLATELARVERAFAPVTERARANQDGWQAQRRALDELTLPWVMAAPEALAWLLGRELYPAERQALHASLALALDVEPDAGSLDYHAGNVVCNGSRLTLVDWSAVGVDWPERRLVQYGTATGAEGAGDGPAGNFATALTPGAVQTYATLAAAQRACSAEQVAQTVDAHDVLLLLTAAASLKMVAGGAAHDERAAAWPNVEQRRTRLMELLRRRLASSGPADELRRRLRRRGS